MDRREALKATSLFLGYALTAGSAAALIGGCKAETSTDWTPKTLSAEQSDLLAEICETIFPKTDTPGAKDALCHRYIDELLTNFYDAEKQKYFLEALGVFDEKSKLSSTTFTMSNNRGTQFNWRGKSPDEDVFFNFIAASNYIAETMGLRVVEGRDFADGFRVDTGAYILNEEAVRQMHLENPIGEIIETYGGKGEIVGVVKDFHLESLHNPIGPVIITCQPDWTWTIYTRLQGDDLGLQNHSTDRTSL